MRPDNVIVIKTDITEIAGTADSAGAPSVDYRATGTGPVVVLREGKRYEGTWNRQGRRTPSRTPRAPPSCLSPASTWIHIVPDDVRRDELSALAV